MLILAVTSTSGSPFFPFLVVEVKWKIWLSGLLPMLFHVVYSFPVTLSYPLIFCF